MIRYHTLLDQLAQAGLLLDGQGSSDDRVIDHLADDSRKVGPQGLFVAVRGEAADGHLFIEKAVTNGAIAIVCEAVPADAATRYPGTAFARVRDGRAVIALLAAAFYGFPAQYLRMVGVTGTNGKTTVANLVHHALNALGWETGLVGTISYRVGSEVLEATHTTPGAISLHRLLRGMVEQGCMACSMEVSSHALSQERTKGVPFDVGIFTNLTQDHLDYHESWDAYLKAKKRLFDGLPAEATALYNADDAAGIAMVEDTSANVLSYGQIADADIQVAVLDNQMDGLRLRLDGVEQQFRLVGPFNAYNVAAAYGAGRALGFSQTEVLDALATAPPVPGRFEQLRFASGTTVVVDYAHTPDALENILRAVRTTVPKHAVLWCIFGCGGDRDKAKRRIMGSIVEQFADRVIVTSDNPRTEDPLSIMNDIRRGMNRPIDAFWIVNRREAIREAAFRAQPGDVVLIAGKGHEAYQVIGTDKFPFDDRLEAQRAFDEQGKG